MKKLPGCIASILPPLNKRAPFPQLTFRLDGIEMRSFNLQEHFFPLSDCRDARVRLASTMLSLLIAESDLDAPADPQVSLLPAEPVCPLASVFDRFLPSSWAFNPASVEQRALRLPEAVNGRVAVKLASPGGITMLSKFASCAARAALAAILSLCFVSRK